MTKKGIALVLLSTMLLSSTVYAAPEKREFKFSFELPENETYQDHTSPYGESERMYPEPGNEAYTSSPCEEIIGSTGEISVCGTDILHVEPNRAELMVRIRDENFIRFIAEHAQSAEIKYEDEMRSVATIFCGASDVFRLYKMIDGNHVEFIGIKYTDCDYDKKYKECLETAIQRARDKADAIALASGQEITEVIKIEEGYEDGYYRYIIPESDILSPKAIDLRIYVSAIFGTV